ncbi:MAG TPA: VOC family protein [Roseomonas sp.]|jgi:catechol 2,3-dioxygenase-like lactoylglutathione lyase family enzyme
MPRIEAFSTVLPVAEMDRSISYYVEGLGFRENFRIGEPATYVMLCRGALSVQLMPGLRAPRAVGMAAIYAFVRELDALHAEFTARGVPIEMPLQDHPYGMREFSIRDPDGNRLTFGQEVGQDRVLMGWDRQQT